MFPQVEGVEVEKGGEAKGQVAGGLGGQMFAASRRRRAEARCGGSIGQVLGGLRNGGAEYREGFWDGGNGPVGRLTAGVTRRLGSGSSRGARMAVEGFPSRAYGSVPVPRTKWLGNLTERLTGHLPARLTPRLPRGLTESGFRGVGSRAKGVKKPG